MPSWTTWTRLEPQVRDTQLDASLKAGVHDPLWLLARQYQLGEFEGEDAGTPVRVEHRYTHNPITHIYPGVYATDSAGVTLPVQKAQSYTGLPLEMLVEREPQVVDFQTRAEAGLHLLRMLRGLASKYRLLLLAKDYALEPNPAARLSRILASRAPDGQKLYTVFSTIPQGEPLPIFDQADQEVAAPIVENWLAIYMPIFDATPAPSAWVPERLEYEFAIAASAVTLAASDYPGGGLDWYTFDVDIVHKLSRIEEAAQSAEEKVETMLPTPVRFPDMPAARFWEFEDARVSLGRPTAGPEDLAQTMLVEFALVYGDDFFIIPHEMYFGSISNTIRLTVTDSFSQVTVIEAAAQIDPQWRLFQFSPDRRWTQAANVSTQMLFLPPTLGKTEHSEPLEEVLFLRDEMANLVWGVERRATTDIGRIDRYDNPEESTPETTNWTYRLSTHVPTNWVPLVPVQMNDTHRAVQLEVIHSSHTPMGQILQPNHQHIHEEEIPRSGVTILRRYQYARWQDGSHHVWIERHKTAGRGEGWSGLRFDVLDLE